jgi:hypothetical protein
VPPCRRLVLSLHFTAPQLGVACLIAGRGGLDTEPDEVVVIFCPPRVSPTQASTHASSQAPSQAPSQVSPPPAAPPKTSPQSPHCISLGRIQSE